MGNDCLVTVDGTDFMVPETCRKFYSFKFKKSGLRYEVCLCIVTGDIVWVHGPFPCGQYNDLMIFRSCLMHHLGPDERVEADDGYIGEHPEHIKYPRDFTNPKKTEFMQQRVRNEQETVNKRFKNWGILKQVFRGRIEDHGTILHAIATITQVTINNGEKLFDCGYKDPQFWDKNDEDEDEDDEDYVEGESDEESLDSDLSYESDLSYANNDK